ncbi:hypothetical protein, partial, partial [Absidia glauca]
MQDYNSTPPILSSLTVLILIVPTHYILIRHQISPQASAFIKEEGHSFLPVIFGASREFSDNNDSSLALIDGRCGFFSVKQHSGPGTSVTHLIGVVNNSLGQLSISRYMKVRTDENGDLLVEPSNQWYSIDDLVLEGILDLDYREPLGHYVVNRFKFGSYWLLNS